MLISVEITETLKQEKIARGISWRFAIEQGLKAVEYKERVEKMSKLISELAQENDDLKNKISGLQSFLKKN